MAIALLMASTLLGAWAYDKEMIVTMCFGTLGIIAAVAMLWSENRRAYRMMQQLLSSLSMQDYSVAFNEGQKATDIDALARNINSIVDSYKQREMEMQMRLSYFETLLGSIDTALLVTTAEGHVEWTNRATADLIRYVPHHIDQLSAIDATLPPAMRKMLPGRSLQLHLRKGTPDEAHLVADVSLYTTGHRTLHIYSIRNIREVLEDNEQQSWQKLIRVLTHEIMNSLTPIISLSETLEVYLPICDETSSCHPEQSEGSLRHTDREILHCGQNDNKKTVYYDTESTAILRQGLQTIHRRSDGLLEFMKNYRKVALVPQPQIAEVSAADLVNPLIPLFVSTECITYHFALQHPETLLHIDRTQMEQVLINLLKNATEACADMPHAVVTVTDSMEPTTNRYLLHVTDNGPGILPEVQERIFIPFFTTKPQGSGIGLALSKQIVHLHGGALRVVSNVGSTCFTVRV